MHVFWNPEADAELTEAAIYYSQRVATLGVEFLDAIDDAVAEIVRDPLRHPIIEDDVRRFRVSRFPYCVYFCLRGDELRILALAHHSREPDYWKHRR
jgi:hypothetical protein